MPGQAHAAGPVVPKCTHRIGGLNRFRRVPSGAFARYVLGTALLIGAILFAALSPLVWVLPSSRDRRLARLRRRAAELGLDVQVRTLDHPAPGAAQRVSAGGALRPGRLAVAGYTRTIPRRPETRDGAGAAVETPRWRLFRMAPGEDGRLRALDDLPGWSVDVRRPALGLDEPGYRRRLDAAIALLPSVTGLERDGRGVTAFWDERGDEDAVQALRRGLDAVLAAEGSEGPREPDPSERS